MADSSVVVMKEDLTLAEHRERFAAALESLRVLDEVLWQAHSPGAPAGPWRGLRAEALGETRAPLATGLAALLRQVDDLGGACDAARVAVTAEAIARGEPSSGVTAMTATQWVRHHAPTTRGGGAGQVVALAASFTKPANAAVRTAVDSGRLPVRSAAVVVLEADRLRPVLAPGAEPHVMEGLIAMAADHGPRGCRLIRPALLAKYGRDGQLQLEQDHAKRFVALSQPIEDGTGVVEYRLSLDPEGRAVLEGALGPLSAPRPIAGERDLRTSDQRRGEALVTLVRRAVAAGEGLGASSKAQLVVAMDWESLSSGIRGAGRTLGGSDAGIQLGPDTVRRLACDATIVPMVLGSGGEILDQGRAVRFFTAAQTRRLWLRDGGCTYPDCAMPPHWADAHHLVHWADFGASDLDNAALLCSRHHTVVHSRRLAGQLVCDPSGEHVTWDLTLGSYDQLLARRAAQEPA
ncbi:hypothetical protein GCM10009845_07540 [Pedococcus bigeumensis]